MTLHNEEMLQEKVESPKSRVIRSTTAVSTLLPGTSPLQAASLVMGSHQSGISRFIPAWKELCLKQDSESEEGITQTPRSSKDNQARGRGKALPHNLHASS